MWFEPDPLPSLVPPPPPPGYMGEVDPKVQLTVTQPHYCSSGIVTIAAGETYVQLYNKPGCYWDDNTVVLVSPADSETALIANTVTDGKTNFACPHVNPMPNSPILSWDPTVNYPADSVVSWVPNFVVGTTKPKYYGAVAWRAVTSVVAGGPSPPNSTNWTLAGIGECFIELFIPAESDTKWCYEVKNQPGLPYPNYTYVQSVP